MPTNKEVDDYGLEAEYRFYPLHAKILISFFNIKYKCGLIDTVNN